MDIKERLKDIAERAKRIIVSPKTDRAAIEAEPTTALDLYRNYILYLAAVPVWVFLGGWLFGFSRGSSVVHYSFAHRPHSLALHPVRPAQLAHGVVMALSLLAR